MKMKNIRKTLHCFTKRITCLLSIFFLCNPGGILAGQSKTPIIEDKSEIKIYRDIRYWNKPDGIEQDSSSDRVLDLYLPQGNKEKLPVFVFIHGGGFSGGDKKSTEALCSKMSASGFAVVSVNYYLTLKHEKVPGVSCSAYMSKGLSEKAFHPVLQKAIKNASSDVQLAFGWIKDNAVRYNFDLSSLSISGGSAGAMTALYTAYISDQKILPIKAVVNLWGGLENSGLIKKGCPPLLSYHGDLDKLIHIDYAYALQSRMKEIGNSKSALHVLEGKGHAMYNLITKEKIEEIAAFLKSNSK
jgi:acetyl esterase/lipase